MRNEKQGTGGRQQAFPPNPSGQGGRSRNNRPPLGFAKAATIKNPAASSGVFLRLLFGKLVKQHLLTAPRGGVLNPKGINFDRHNSGIAFIHLNFMSMKKKVMGTLLNIYQAV
ncbi:MAG: hypothetical protein LBH43_20845 [Treponema sp.]|jgi:hypothetical protein|nr:hypothetical protein [Treponema sp.]